MYCPIWLIFYVNYLNIMVLNIYKFREHRRMKGCKFFMVVNEITLMCVS